MAGFKRITLVPKEIMVSSAVEVYEMTYESLRKTNYSLFF